MSRVEVRDNVLWVKHIQGNESLKTKINELNEGCRIELEVDGYRGTWEKMKDGKDGMPTTGIKPLGPAKEHWSRVLKDKRRCLVKISEPSR